VRSLARDLGLALETGGHCASLRRTAVGPFTLKLAKRLEDLPEHIDESCVIPLETALGALSTMGALSAQPQPASPHGAPDGPRGS